MNNINFQCEQSGSQEIEHLIHTRIDKQKTFYTRTSHIECFPPLNHYSRNNKKIADLNIKLSVKSLKQFGNGLLEPFLRIYYSRLRSFLTRL